MCTNITVLILGYQYHSWYCDFNILYNGHKMVVVVFLDCLSSFDIWLCLLCTRKSFRPDIFVCLLSNIWHKPRQFCHGCCYGWMIVMAVVQHQETWKCYDMKIPDKWALGLRDIWAMKTIAITSSNCFFTDTASYQTLRLHPVVNWLEGIAVKALVK